jgi:predicted Zn-dependent protease
VILAGWVGVEPEVDSAWALVRAVEDGFGIERWPHGHLQAAAVLARAGDADSAHAVVDRVRQSTPPDPWLDYYEANVRLQLGEEDRALGLLEAFTEAMPHRRSYIVRDWWWKPLRQAPRFQALGAHP